ncbi:MAG TPA: hypothetical protein VLX44_03355 [Xanthobacteraceae bacterium]|nr:hypothetical protein [Xanthobacteraceae bacterium]
MWQKASAKTLSALIGVVLLSGAAHAAPLPNIGELVTIDVAYFGCRSLDDLAHVVNLDWVRNDKDAATAYGKEHCVVLRKGDQLKVQDVSAVQGAVCLRQLRTSECHWTSAQVLKGP